MDTTPSIASEAHDHDHCIANAMQNAKSICQRNGVRMTALREEVLRLIWQSHKPLGAYKLMAMLAESATRQIAPPTVYRTLEFLLEQGLIHRINTLNAYVGCTHPGASHADNFLICRNCGIAIEFTDAQIQESIRAIASKFAFKVDTQAIELAGFCQNCLDSSAVEETP